MVSDARKLTVVVPEGWHAVTPQIVVLGAEELIRFLKLVFRATGNYRPDAPAVVTIGDSHVMISEAGIREARPAFLYVYVEDVDGTYERAIQEGAISEEKPSELPYGDRRAMLRDQWGNLWQIASPVGKTNAD